VPFKSQRSVESMPAVEELDEAKRVHFPAGAEGQAVPPMRALATHHMEYRLPSKMVEGRYG
jgi:hypothetical protein